MPPGNEKQATAYWKYQLFRLEATLKEFTVKPEEVFGKKVAAMTPEQKLDNFRESYYNPVYCRNEIAKKFDMKDRIILTNVALFASFVVRTGPLRPTRIIFLTPFLVPEVFRPLFGQFYFKK